MFARGISLLTLLLLLGCRSETAPPGAPAWVTELNPALAIGFELIPEAQVAVLTDGDLTFAEFEAATLAMLDCIVDRGFPLQRPGIFYNEKTHFFDYYIAGVEPGRVDDVGAAIGECGDLHAGYLTVVWQELTKPSVEERLAVAEAMSTCLRREGVDAFPEPGTPAFTNWALNQPDPGPGSYALEVAICFEEVQAEYGFLPGQYG